MKRLLFIMIATVILCSGCSSAPGTVENADVVKKLLEGADWAEGRPSLIVNGKKYNADSTGLVCAVYSYAGLTLPCDSALMLQLLDENKLLYTRGMPMPGDILFVDGCCVGMAVKVNGKKGDILYIGYDSKKGISFISTKQKFRQIGRGSML